MRWISRGFAVALILSVVGCPGTPGPVAPSRKVTIEKPKDDGEIRHETSIQGTYSSIPDGYQIWVVVSIGGRFYPSAKADLLQNGTWTATAWVGSGPDEDIGKTFGILAVLADPGASGELDKYIQAKEWTGLDRLPAGAEICDRVTVKRI